ncbi:Peroxisomal biogenesis factor 8 [Fusarium oxysporum f. sp. cubense race 1]|uniref:Peroxisomal biogenesis factor 8 n=1 Tax=Fusarium oxysporum f. sp. cubense (strain race 1) TaxID=1229664 RepID=N4U611_FUSC1|nr:Peroxisomal biogenesis factor 8 [Fusarium oxysporum f. sp. cubense race 1]
MSSDRLLRTVLQHYPDVHDAAKTEQIIGSTTHLLTELTNPLNLGLLTSQLLTAPAIWFQPGGIRTSVRVISIYNTAAARIHNYEVANRDRKEPHEGGGLSCEEWTRAVVKGADDRSRRWQHLLVLTGVLMGMESSNRQSLSRGMRNTLEEAVVMAANLALESRDEDGPVAGASVVMALNFAFPLLSDFHRSLINCNALLPLIVWTVTAEEGFGHGQFLAAVSSEVVESPNHLLAWSPNTPSFRFIQELDRRPTLANMGPLAKLAGTWPVLWNLLRKLMFGTVAILQAIVSRSLLDPRMLNDIAAPVIASKSLRILRNIFFISSRNGNSAFQVYNFTYLTSIDSISRSAPACHRFLQEFRPSEDASTSTTYLQRTLDLFYLNLSEHLPLSLPTDACDALIIKPAIAYISHEGPTTQNMVEIFESAHSAILSTISCPQHSPLTIELTPFYIALLFNSFPQHISSRQFRVAFKTVMQIVSPPFPIAELEPQLSETLLEMLRASISTASTSLLPPTADIVAQAAMEETQEERHSQQSSLALALVDSLPYLPLPLVEEWFTIAAQAMNEIEDPVLREPVKQRFLQILVSGELDVERAAIGVAWWGTRGGRTLILGASAEPAMMSGALPGPDRSSHL